MTAINTHTLNTLSAINVDLDLDEKITPQELSLIKENVEYWDRPGKFWLSKTVNLIEDCGLDRIGKLFDRYVQVYARKTLGINYNFSRVSSWLTFNTDGTFHHGHNHPNSMISGVLYFNEDLTDENLTSMNFVLPGLNSTFRDFKFHFEIENHNNHNLRSLNMDVKSNRMIIFPSWMSHSTDVSRTDEKRYCIGVNYFLADSIKPNTLEQIDLS